MRPEISRKMRPFKVISDFSPAGDQPTAIAELTQRLLNKEKDVVLLGVGLQKDYGVILRDEFGKIALDMGATMDAWAGIISRPWFNKGQSQEYLLM